MERLETDWHVVSDVARCPILQLAHPMTTAGQPSVTEVISNLTVPFTVRRVYYLYDVPADSERGGHSHRQHHEVLVAVSGSVDVDLFDGRHHSKVHLNRPWVGLQITPGIWRVLNNFSAGCVLLVLTSHPYSEADYVRHYDEFTELTARKSVATAHDAPTISD